MSEYIITDEQINRIVTAAANHQPEKYESIAEELLKAEIIRCKDCCDYIMEGDWKSGAFYCQYHESFPSSDGFCSWAERREN